jgi:predicted PurR-regulated permease PerM
MLGPASLCEPIVTHRHMKPTRPLLFWTVTSAVTATVLILLHRVLLPFVLAATFAYLLDPLVNRLERIGIKRTYAALFITGIVIVFIVSLLLLGIPIIGAEVAAFIDNIPTYINRMRALFDDPNHPWVYKIFGLASTEAEKSSGELGPMITGFLQSVWSGGWAVLSLFSLFVVTPIVTVYLIHDWKRIIVTLDRSLPPEHRARVRELAAEIDLRLTSFIRGQAMICVVLAAFYAIALRSIGLNHGLLIGIIAGLFGFVPYAGALTGLLLAASVSVLQFGLIWTPLLAIFGIFFVGQSLADYLLAPILVGHKVHLNPVWLMFALFSFGFLFGFIGLLVAVPLAAGFGVLVRFGVGQYFAGASEPLISTAGARMDVDPAKLAGKTTHPLQ